VTGLPVRRASGLIHDVAAHVLHATAPRPGEQIALRGGQPVLGSRVPARRRAA
jgi:hypothetical protein